MRIFGASLVGILLILWGCSNIPDSAQDQFWNVFILGSVTWLILVTAWVQIGVSEKQWKSMQDGLTKTQELLVQNERTIDAAQRQAAVAEKSLVLSEGMYYEAQRAYVSVSSVQLEELPEMRVRLYTVLCNKGNTPAWDVTPLFRIGIGPLPMDPNDAPFPEAHPEQVVAELPANDECLIRGNAFSLPDYELEFIKSRQKAFILTIKITYRCIQGSVEEVVSHHLYDAHDNVFLRRKEWPSSFEVGWGGDSRFDAQV